MIKTFNDNHTYACLMYHKKVYKPQLYRTVKDSPGYKKYYAVELRKSEIEFEKVFYLDSEWLKNSTDRIKQDIKNTNDGLKEDK